MENDKIIVTEMTGETDDNQIDNPVLDGFHISRFKENLLQSGASDEKVSNILSNAYQSIGYFKRCGDNVGSHTPIKILCLGKVQSGKTSFFLAATALAFDNGYDVAYVLGGTKIKLKNQNYDRITDAFINNEKIEIKNANGDFNEDIRKYVSHGYKVIVVILKNAAKNTNLGVLSKLAEKYHDIPSVIIDDEGDEYTPGAEKMVKKNSKAGKTHDRIVSIVNSFQTCTFLSVTATPQANLLVSTFDGISPDRLVLVRPGNGYTGGHSFFDTKENFHVITIEDNDDFESSMPDSFKNALYFFIFACALKRSIGDKDPFTMLVHPSSFNSDQNNVAKKISDYIDSSINPVLLDVDSIEFDDLMIEIRNAYETYSTHYDISNYSFDAIKNEVLPVINELKVQIVNYTNSYDDDESDNERYKIKVGGNMLGRGLTIDRLIVSYIYRDSKVAQVDTMYQRCRWFGYKLEYFDVCRVYMTDDLQTKFMAIVKNEDHMWNSLEAFLDTQINLKKFKRVFLLEDNRLVLTRKSISNTVTLSSVSSEHKADMCICLSMQEIIDNRNTYLEYCKECEITGELIDFDNSQDHKQRHLVVHESFNNFYKKYLSKIHYGFGSPFSISLFDKMLCRINEGLYPDDVIVMLMRYGKGENRSPNNSTNMNISYLFQGYNDGTRFSGDKYPVDINGNNYSNVPFFQIHMVDINNRVPKFDECIPLLSYNSAITSKVIKLVTGDNFYEE